MRIRMLQTVEDMHGYQVEQPGGGVAIDYDTRKFYGGQEYTPENGGPDFDCRARSFVRFGYAEEVAEAPA